MGKSVLNDEEYCFGLLLGIGDFFERRRWQLLHLIAVKVSRVRPCIFIKLITFYPHTVRSGMVINVKHKGFRSDIE